MKADKACIDVAAGRAPADLVFKNVNVVNVFSEEIDPDVHFVSVYFLEEEEGRRREKGVYVKMARGEMVRWLAEQNIQQFDDVKRFCRLGYRFDATVSDDKQYHFVRKADWKRSKYKAV